MHSNPNATYTASGTYYLPTATMHRVAGSKQGAVKLARLPYTVPVGATVLAYGGPATVTAYGVNRNGVNAVALTVVGSGKVLYALPPLNGAVQWANTATYSGANGGGNAPANAPHPVAHGHYYGGRGKAGQAHM